MDFLLASHENKNYQSQTESFNCFLRKTKTFDMLILSTVLASIYCIYEHRYLYDFNSMNEPFLLLFLILVQMPIFPFSSVMIIIDELVLLLFLYQNFSSLHASFYVTYSIPKFITLIVCEARICIFQI